MSQGAKVLVDFYEFGIRTGIGVEFVSVEAAQAEIEASEDLEKGCWGIIVPRGRDLTTEELIEEVSQCIV